MSRSSRRLRRVLAYKNKVFRSINLHYEHICVDVFLRPNNTFGFDKFSRDPENLSD